MKTFLLLVVLATATSASAAPLANQQPRLVVIVDRAPPTPCFVWRVLGWFYPIAAR